MDNWCIIPARGGSKAIPRKNIVELAGRPLIAYTICAALVAKTVSRVIVSTDDEEIAQVARYWGAEVPFLRPADLARDDSPTLPAIQHAVGFLEKSELRSPGLITLLQPTSPFTRPDQIDVAVSKIVSDETADAVTTVLEIDHVNHPYNVRVGKSYGYVDFFMPQEHYKYPTRQSKPTFLRFGNLYVVRRNTVMDAGSLFGQHCIPSIVDLPSCFDINDSADLQIAACMIDARVVDPSYCVRRKDA